MLRYMWNSEQCLSGDRAVRAIRDLEPTCGFEFCEGLVAVWVQTQLYLLIAV